MKGKWGMIAAFAVAFVLVVGIIIAGWNAWNAFLDSQEERPAEDDVDWHAFAVYIERAGPEGTDVVTMGQRNDIAFAAICLPPDVEDDAKFYAGTLAVEALLVFGNEYNEHLALSFLTPPVGDEPRYPLDYAVACEIVDGELGDCQGGPMQGGYLSAESVRWPGAER